jgi:translation initiation factor IF-2
MEDKHSSESPQGGESRARFLAALMGQPGCGKTALFEALTSMHQPTHYGSRLKSAGIGLVDTDGLFPVISPLNVQAAEIADVVILVVDGKDGVREGTREALRSARKFKKPIVVAVSKVEWFPADPERVAREVAEHGLIPSEWGGDTPFIRTSAVTDKGLDGLIDAMMDILGIPGERSSENDGR